MRFEIKKPRVEVADIFRQYGSAYRRDHLLPLDHLRVMRAIEICRTSELGGHISKCDTCGSEHPVYNSCRNRHCPKCQFSRTEKWLEARKKETLPISYFHVVFTLPDTLKPLARMNQKAIYDILFKSVSETLLELGQDPQHLGAHLGAICILHTWGQNMMFHPHIHCIVTGGGLSTDSKRWISSKPDFFIHVFVLAEIFRGKFLFHLKRLHQNKALRFSEDIKHLSQTSPFSTYIRGLYKINWVVYANPPFNGVKSVIEYLGRYTHKVAISNHRLLQMQNGKVTFKYRDYADNNREKEMTLEAPEFIRRFLLHVLPNKFVKIRYYGILSSRKKKMMLQLVRSLLSTFEEVCSNDEDTFSCEELPVCPACKKGRLVKTRLLPPQCRAP